ncbi:hypothetical protein [Microbulbifer rhizosphaerae]|uniref:Uncharacterized protein n=1 Tax=Microbulbifer rhizosphaerae TaxID=1562603 RepID=A0A7W4W9J0_9GAMM|nr:hypothetical protein [Microbulbifer rhizosphaerae]MBB3060136.1 hypothetical protein [Microbulbifer rhizosphaerae]
MPINISVAEALLILIQQNKEVLGNVLAFQNVLESVVINWGDDQVPQVELENGLNNLIQEIEKSRNVVQSLLEGLATQSI